MRRDQVRANLDLIELELASRRKRERADRQIAHMMYRQRKLPEQLERARARVAQLEREAARLGMAHLLEQKAQQ